MNDKKWFKMSKKSAIGIFVFYGLLFILSISISVLNIVSNPLFAAMQITERAVIGGLSFSILGSVIYYSKKLYKTFISLSFTIPTTDDEKLQLFGLVAYFILRPIFSVVFSLLVVLFLKLGCKIVTATDGNLNDGFIYLTIVLSFFCGFSSGDVLDLFDNIGKEAVKNLFKGVE